MTGTTLERDARRRSLLVSVVCWLTPLAVGLLGVVLLRLRIEAVNGSNLETGDRFFLLGAVIFMPLTCYAASAKAVLLTWPRQTASRYLWLAVALASGLAVSGWLLMFGRG
jgi:hypothetical protein